MTFSLYWVYLLFLLIPVLLYCPFFLDYLINVPTKMPVQQSPSNTTPSQQEQFILIVAAIILPPLAIFLSKKYSIWNKEFWISVVLTLIGHIPGAIFAVYYLLYVQYPQQGVEGYTQLPDDVEQQLHAEHQQELNQEQQQGIRIYHDEEHVQPKENQILTANDLPSYDDIVGSSEGTTEHRDVKGGDNKIQH